jgi:hypothetical protein
MSRMAAASVLVRIKEDDFIFLSSSCFRMSFFSLAWGRFYVIYLQDSNI